MNVIATQEGLDLVVTRTGTVTSGPFTGDVFNETITYLAPDFAQKCASTGITSLTGTTVLVVD
ncbi:hypothetical protein [Kitasatospora griseola]